MKKLVIIMAVIASFCLLTMAYAASKGADEMTISSKVYAKHTKGLVKFTHKKHYTDYKIACTDCHHEFKDGKNVWKEGMAVKKCDSCHSVAKPMAQLSPAEKKQMASPELAYHKNCKDCHMKAKKEGKKAPVACTECHGPAIK